MRPLLTSAIVAAIATAVLPAIPRSAVAATPVLRCEMPDGTSVYTSKACRSLGAIAKPLSADALARIAEEQRREDAMVAAQANQQIVAFAANAAAITAAATRRPMARGCASTPQQLALDLQGSVALADVNRLAESFDWAGMDNAQGQRIMARLEQVAKRSVVSTQYFDASLGAGTLYADAGSGSTGSTDGAAGLLQVTFDAGNGNSIADFSVRREQGCYFLRF